jgi:cytochrome d ubiquinol oxidase subunit II
VSLFPFPLPSSLDPRSSLIVWDASSSPTTLFIMLVATLVFLPIVIACTGWMNRRQSDCVIVSQGLDRNIHGGASEKKKSTPTIAAAWCSDRSPIT